jgi:hypothetical protein
MIYTESAVATCGFENQRPGLRLGKNRIAVLLTAISRLERSVK